LIKTEQRAGFSLSSWNWWF